MVTTFSFPVSRVCLHESASRHDQNATHWLVCEPSPQSHDYQLSGVVHLRSGYPFYQSAALDVRYRHQRLLAVDFGNISDLLANFFWLASSLLELSALQGKL